jgi:ribosome biogenesis GTPase
MTEFEKGVVIATRGRLFEVMTESGNSLKCEVRRKVKSEADSTTPVAVGDDVLISPSHEGSAIIEKVLERKTAFFRPTVQQETIKQVIAANLDKLAIVSSITFPELKTGLIDRFLISAQLGKLEPIIIFNKTDLPKPKDFDTIVNTYQSLGYKTFPTSCETGQGLDVLKEAMSDHRTVLVGHSGVGKSSIINRLIPGLDLKTATISESSSRGKHTTAHIELFELPSGGFLADSPGLKVMGIWDVAKNELPYFYPEFERFFGNCRFKNCAHIHEPDCAVKGAVESGEIESFRYENYLSIVESL